MRVSRRWRPRGRSDQFYLFDKKKKLVVGPVGSKDRALRKFDGKVPDGYKLYAVPPGTVVVSCGVGEVVCPGVSEANPTSNSYYLFKYSPPDVPEMTGSDLKLSGTRQDFDTQTQAPIVTMQFTKKGAKRFAEITREEAQRGKLLSNTIGGGQKIEQHFAIVLDREIKSWPSIDWDQYPGGISGSNGAQITGIGDVQEAKNLALVLQTGALPVEFVTLDQTAISATLGKDSLNEAKKAAIVGLLLVALFLLVFYRFLGLIAVLGLGIYAAFLYAAILLFNVTLTLPGFAGLVLTLGVAADANVVIFERIKEEARAGRSVKAAIQTGYTKGFATIVDANVVTAITALVLFAVATSSVRGFALMLLIGTAISMLTAVLATRAFLSLLAGSKIPREPPRDRHLGRRHPVLAEDRLHPPAAALVRDLGHRDRDLGPRPRRPGPQPRHRLQGRHPDRLPDAGTDVPRGGARTGRARRAGERPDPGSRALDQRQLQELPGPHQDAHVRRSGPVPGGSETDGAGRRVRGQERVVELRPPDRALRHPRDHRLAAPDRRLHLAALPVAVRGARDRGADPRHPDHRSGSTPCSGGR